MARRSGKGGVVGGDVGALLSRCIELRNYPEKLIAFAFDLQLAGWQREYLEAWGAHLRSGSREPFRASIVSGHGTGKSTLSGLVTWCHLLAWPRSRSIILSNTWVQAITRTMRTAIELKDKLLPPLRDLFEVSQASIRWRDENFKYSWLAEVIAWTPDRLEGAQGYHADYVNIIADEASALPATLFEVFEGAMTTGQCHLLAIGNPTTTSGYQYRVMTDARVAEQWKHRRHLSSYDVPWANKAALDGMVRAWGGPETDISRVRIFGQYPRTGSLSLFPRDVLDAAVQRVVDPRVGARCRPIIACDPAFSGQDLATIALRTEHTVGVIEMLPKCDLLDLAERLAMLAKKHNAQAIVADTTGAGGEGVIAVLKGMRQRLPANIRLVAFNAAATANREQHFVNARVEAYGRLLEALRNGIALKADDELIEELLATERDGSDGRGRMRLIPKKDIATLIGRSPDRADAVAMTFTVPIRATDSLSFEGQTHAEMFAGQGHGIGSPFWRGGLTTGQM
jgi:hypothetical protein